MKVFKTILLVIIICSRFSKILYGQEDFTSCVPTAIDATEMGSENYININFLEDLAITNSDSSILSDNSGEIAHILVQFQPETWPTDIAMYESLLSQLDSDIRITAIVSNPQEALRIESFTKDWGIDNIDILTYSDTGGGYTGLYNFAWAEDDREIIQNVDGTITVVVPARDDQTSSGTIEEMLAQEYPDIVSDIIRSDLYFDGGDIITNEDYMFIGYTTIQRNIDKLGIDANEIAARFESLFGKNIIVIGGEDNAPPYFHIDMYLTPVGDNKILLADPQLCSNIVQNWSDEEKIDYALNLHRRLQGFSVFTNFFSLFDHSLEENLTEEIQGSLNDIAEYLERTGFEVTRVPFLKKASEHEESSGFSYPFITYNNAVLEERGGQKTAYVPIYGLPFDDIAIAIYQDLGFKVIEVDVAEISTYSGAVQCKVKVLLRNY